MAEEQRYLIDRLDKYDWLLFDSTKPRNSTVYLLYAQPVSSVLNTQIILVTYDGVESSPFAFNIFLRELYSTKIYSCDVEQFMHVILQDIQDCDIENPVELAAAFGGQINSTQVRVPKLPSSLVN